MSSHPSTSGEIHQALRLSASLSAQTPPSERELTAKSRDDCQIILVVDDEEPMRWIIHEILRSTGHIVLCADNAALAKRIASYNINIDLLITDVRLPGTDGMELAAWFQQQFPQTKRLYVSGDPQWLLERSNDPIPQHFLAKPFIVEEFLAKIKEILAEERAA